MDEIDKKIEEIEKKNRKYNIRPFGDFKNYEIIDEEKEWLIDEFKKCREENKMFRSVNVEFAEKWIERTKDACLFNLGKTWAKRHKKIGYETWITYESARRAIQETVIDETRVE